MSPEVAVLLALIGEWQAHNAAPARGKPWRAPRQWRETCPWPGCSEQRGDVRAFIAHFDTHVQRGMAAA